MNGSRQSVCADGTGHRPAHQPHSRRPSGAVRHGECNVGTDRLDAWARLDEEPARLDEPESRFSHRYRPPRSPVAAKHQRVRTDRGQDGPAAGMSWVPGCVARSGTARGRWSSRKWWARSERWPHDEPVRRDSNEPAERHESEVDYRPMPSSGHAPLMKTDGVPLIWSGR